MKYRLLKMAPDSLPNLEPSFLSGLISFLCFLVHYPSCWHLPSSKCLHSMYLLLGLFFQQFITQLPSSHFRLQLKYFLFRDASSNLTTEKQSSTSWSHSIILNYFVFFIEFIRDWNYFICIFVHVISFFLLLNLLHLTWKQGLLLLPNPLGS